MDNFKLASKMLSKIFLLVFISINIKMNLCHNEEKYLIFFFF